MLDPVSVLPLAPLEGPVMQRVLPGQTTPLARLSQLRQISTGCGRTGSGLCLGTRHWITVSSINGNSSSSEGREVSVTPFGFIESFLQGTFHRYWVDLLGKLLWGFPLRVFIFLFVVPAVAVYASILVRYISALARVDWKRFWSADKGAIADCEQVYGPLFKMCFLLFVVFNMQMVVGTSGCNLYTNDSAMGDLAQIKSSVDDLKNVGEEIREDLDRMREDLDRIQVKVAPTPMQKAGIR